MPDKSRRRKNNKNKRNNKKNNKIDINKNNIDESNGLASCSNLSRGEINSDSIRITENHNLLVPLKNDKEENNQEECCVMELEKPTEINLEKESEEFSITQKYTVETPEQIQKIKPKLLSNVKSKSCDNDDCPTIVEILDESNGQNQKPIEESNNVEGTNVVTSTEEPHVVWENVNELNLPQAEVVKSILSTNTIPLNIAHCQHTKLLSSEEELSLRNYLKTLNLSNNPPNMGDIKTEIEHTINREVKYRLRKKGLADDILFTRPGPSRSLTVIDEEISGDSSKAVSRRQSYLSDKKSDNEELDDDIFESENSKRISNHLIPQQCIRVDAKLRDPEISEARGDWTVKTIEKLTGAELIYLTDSSSSTSSLYDTNDESNKFDENGTNIRIITPTIEVTDTEKLLTNLYIDEPKNIKENQPSTLDGSINSPTINTCYDKTTLRNDQVIDCKNNDDSYEITVLSNNDFKSNLFVKDPENCEAEKINVARGANEVNKTQNDFLSTKKADHYDLDIKVLKCELNDAINHLIKEVISDSETIDSPKDMIIRQDSSSSLDSSQCTAKYNPTSSSLNDVSNILNDDTSENVSKEYLSSNGSHVKDVISFIATNQDLKIMPKLKINPLSLKDICLNKITSLPYGHKIVEELANVSERLQKSVLISSYKGEKEQNLVGKRNVLKEESNITQKKFNYNNREQNDNICIPPPVLPRKSSIKKNNDDQHKLILQNPPIKSLCECLSPSQRMLMEKTNTKTEKTDRILMENKDPFSPSTSEILKQPDITKLTTENELSKEFNTGSRLLSFILESQPNKSNSTSFKVLSAQSLDDVSKIKSRTESFSKRALEEIDSAFFSDLSTNNKSSFIHSHNQVKLKAPSKQKKMYFYESDESSNCRDTSFKTMQKSKKYFHYSTGNLNKEIESDITSIQNMHRFYTDLRDINNDIVPRRPSLPKDLCDQQMEYIRHKEKEVDDEIRRLEKIQNQNFRSKGPRAPMINETNDVNNKYHEPKINTIVTSNNLTFRSQNVRKSGKTGMSSLFSSSQEELLREKMYSEYIKQIAEREERKQQKVIKITKMPDGSKFSKSMPVLENLEPGVNNRIEEEFITKARERWYKLGIRDPDMEDEKEIVKNMYREPKIIDHKIKVIEEGEEKDLKKLPSHMQEFVKFTVRDKDNAKDGAGESQSGQAPAHVVVLCAVVILVITVSKYLLRLIRNK